MGAKQKIKVTASDNCQLLFAEREEAAAVAAEKDKQRQEKENSEAALQAEIDEPNNCLDE